MKKHLTDDYIDTTDFQVTAESLAALKIILKDFGLTDNEISLFDDDELSRAYQDYMWENHHGCGAGATFSSFIEVLRHDTWVGRDDRRYIR